MRRRPEELVDIFINGNKYINGWKELAKEECIQVLT